MAIEVSSWVWKHSRSKNAERLVMLAVADACHNADGTGAWMSNAALMEKTNLSERAVQNATAGCERLGELKIERNAGRGGVNRYTVVMVTRNPAESAPFSDTPQNLHPAESAPFGDGADGTDAQASDGKGADSAGQAEAGKGAESAPGTVSTKNSSTKSSPSPKKRPRKPRVADIPRPDVDEICAYLADKIEANGSKRPTITAEWRKDARLLLDEKRPIQPDVIKVKRLIDWCQANQFWRKNVMSMPKLREQWDRLRLDALADLDKQKRQAEREREDPFAKPASTAPKAIPLAERCGKHPSYRATTCGPCRADRLAGKQEATT